MLREKVEQELERQIVLLGVLDVITMSDEVANVANTIKTLTQLLELCHRPVSDNPRTIGNV